MNELDVDSIVLPICTQELFKWPAISLVELLATPQAVKDVSGAVCVGRMGYCIFAFMDNQKKLELCARITVAGVLLIMPHTADTNFMYWTQYNYQFAYVDKVSATMWDY